jgi:hypothetical protein
MLVSSQPDVKGRSAMKLRVALATAALGAVTVLGLAACSPLAASAAAVDMSPEASALSALGFSPDQVVPAADTSPSPAASGTPAKPGASAHPGGKHPALRRLTIRRALAKNVEHGEVVVKTKDGDKTIDVQRGTVTAISSTSITVKSADGFSETWTFGSPIHVIEHRTTVQPSNVTTGATVGLAGTKSGSNLTASLLVIADK